MNGVNPEIRNRIRVAVAAYAYEIRNDPIMTDAEFDRLAREINIDLSTGNQKLDDFFWEHFTPNSGMWVHQHPEPEGLERIYRMMKTRRPKSYDQTHNTDLFGPMLTEPKPFRACSFCGKNTSIPITEPGACCC